MAPAKPFNDRFIMRTIRFFASALATVLLIALCVILAPPAFELRTLGPQYGIGAGALPQFALIATAILVVIMLVRDYMAYRRNGDETAPTEEDALQGSDPAKVVMTGTAVLALLATFILIWAYVGFVVASIAFMLALSLLLLPRERRSLSALAAIGTMAVLFPIGVWALFVHVLMVPLR